MKSLAKVMLYAIICCMILSACAGTAAPPEEVPEVSVSEIGSGSSNGDNENTESAVTPPSIENVQGGTEDVDAASMPTVAPEITGEIQMPTIDLGNLNVDGASDVYHAEAEVVKVGEAMYIPSYGLIELRSIRTANEVKPPLYMNNVAYSYFSDNNDGNTYIEMVFDFKNLSESQISLKDSLKVRASSQTMERYVNGTIYQEEIDDRDSVRLTSRGDIDAGSTSRLHCIMTVPKNQTSVQLQIEINERYYDYDYQLGDLIPGMGKITQGQKLNSPDYASITFQGLQFVDEVSPSAPGVLYQHYKVKDEQNTYLMVICDVCNHQGTAKNINSFFGVEVIDEGGNIYTGFVFSEKEDGSNFESYRGLIDSNGTRKIMSLIEVPKSFENNACDVVLYFDGMAYYCK